MLCLWEGTIFLLQWSIRKNKQELEEKKVCHSGLHSVCAGKQNRIPAPKCKEVWCGAQLMRWCCVAFFWDPVRSTNTSKKNSRQGPQQFGYSGWVKWLLARWISGECLLHSPTFGTSLPNQQKCLRDSGSRCRTSSLWDGELCWALKTPQAPCMDRAHQTDIACACCLCRLPAQPPSQLGYSEEAKTGSL